MLFLLQILASRGCSAMAGPTGDAWLAVEIDQASEVIGRFFDVEK
jgi:hypothetical protein